MTPKQEQSQMMSRDWAVGTLGASHLPTPPSPCKWALMPGLPFLSPSHQPNHLQTQSLLFKTPHLSTFTVDDKGDKEYSRVGLASPFSRFPRITSPHAHWHPLLSFLVSSSPGPPLPEIKYHAFKMMQFILDFWGSFTRNSRDFWIPKAYSSTVFTWWDNIFSTERRSEPCRII